MSKMSYYEVILTLKDRQRTYHIKMKGSKRKALKSAIEMLIDEEGVKKKHIQYNKVTKLKF